MKFPSFPFVDAHVLRMSVSNLFPVDARVTKAWDFESAGEEATGPTLRFFK